MKNLKSFLSLNLILITVAFTNGAYGAADSSRQSIGLALQGGGAKGFAHIGFLQWLEENRVPAHMIAGTSMGGLTGGFYAAGQSPNDLKKLVGTLDWDELIGNQYYLLTAGYLHEIASLPPLIGDKIYASGWYQLGKMYGSSDLPKHPMDASAGLVVKTLLGPIFLGGSWGSNGHHKLYFGLGALF